MRFLSGCGALLGLAVPMLCASAPVPAAVPDARTLPMKFDWRQEGPSSTCAPNCREWISAVGAITSDTPRVFQNFAKGRDLRGATIVLDSDGGSVLGAIALGREVRRLNMTTMVGKTDIGADDKSGAHVKLSPQADCESMCTFVLLAGVKRHVAPEAGVYVHQIWLGDRREDPTAANYSAEDMVLVQRDIGRLAQYTAEMGGSFELLEIALKIPPWEPMHRLTREELRQTKLDTGDGPPGIDAPATVASVTSPMVTSGSRETLEVPQGWAVTDRSGSRVLSRRHPLTIEGENIGSFDLSVACGKTADTFTVSYSEQRRSRDKTLPPLKQVMLQMAGTSTALSVVSSERKAEQLELDTIATGSIPASLIETLASVGNRSVTVSTKGADARTAIRLGNTGIAQNFKQFVSTCAKSAVTEASAPKRAGPPARAH